MGTTIGFIGLGIMGRPMSKNLLRSGYALIVYNRSHAAVRDLVAAGAEAAGSPREVAERADVVITMLPNSPHVQQVLFGTDGVIEGARPGSLVIDMSSIDPLVARDISAALLRRDVHFIDAPVSGGEPKAVEGTLSIMVGGGDEADVAAAEPILRCMGASVVHCGDVGAGNFTKLANQVIVAINIAALSEALILARKAGLDPQRVVDAIRGGLAGSAVLEAKVPMALNRDIRPGFRIDLHIKDLANALAAGHEVGAPLPLTAQVKEIMQGLRVDGLGEADHGAVVRYYEKLARVEVGTSIGSASA